MIEKPLGRSPWLGQHQAMAESRARANSMPVANVLGRNHLVRMLNGWAATGRGALHGQLAERVRHLVNTGELPAGVRLPSERALADGIGVSRNTVGAAFDELRGEGVLVSRQGDGTYVSAAGRNGSVRGDDRLRSFVLSDLAGGLIDLRSAALPGLDLVADELDQMDRGAIGDLLCSHGYVPGGLPGLRQAVACYYRELGLPTQPGQVLVTSGAQQALRLVATALLEPGDFVVIEEPAFRGAIEVLRACGARLVPVPTGAGGVDVDALGSTVRRIRPALVVLQSASHNPTGAVLDESARAAIAQLAQRTGTPVLDDAAVTDALIDAPLPRPMAAFGGPIITVGSASKSFWGGLRVGWLRATPDMVGQLTPVKGAEDLGTSLVAQVLTTRLLGRIDEARAERRTTLGAARQAVLAKLAQDLPDWRPLPPAGGASLWVQLPGCGATALAERAARAGVNILAGPTFSCRDRLDDHLRIAFAMPLDHVLAGIDRLATAAQH
jgi:DNA-binding transcriptional MocR family regulator